MTSRAVAEKIYGSSHRRYSIKKGVLKNFAKFTGKHLCRSLFFKKVASLRPTTFLFKKGFRHRRQVFSCEVYEIFKNTFFTDTSGRLLSVYNLTIINVGFLRVRFAVGGGQAKITLLPFLPCLKLVRIMLEIWNLVRKYTRILSFRKYTF